LPPPPCPNGKLGNSRGPLFCKTARQLLTDETTTVVKQGAAGNFKSNGCPNTERRRMLKLHFDG